MFEESVRLLLRASWFKPLILQAPEEQDDYGDDDDMYESPSKPCIWRVNSFVEGHMDLFGDL